MSTFSGYGMGPKGFLVNRLLNDFEREHCFNIKRSTREGLNNSFARQQAA